MNHKNNILGGGGFHHVAVRVHDFDAAVNFYKALGCTEKLTWGDDDARAIMLDTGDGNYIELFAGGTPEPKHPSGKGAALIHVALRTSDVDAATRAAEAAGATITVQPKDVELGRDRKVKIRISFCQAPGGEVVEFFQCNPAEL